MKILVICNNGNSSSVFAQKMSKVAKKEGKQYQIDAIPPFDVQDVINEYDVVLIAPQIKHDLNRYKKMHKKEKIGVIEPLVFGMLDGKKGIDFAEEIGKS